MFISPKCYPTRNPQPPKPEDDVAGTCTIEELKVVCVAAQSLMDIAADRSALAPVNDDSVEVSDDEDVSDDNALKTRDMLEFFDSFEINQDQNRKRYIAKATRPLQRGEPVCMIEQGTKISDYVQLFLKEYGDENPFDMTEEGLDLPMERILIPTAVQADANVRLEKDEDITWLIATQPIVPGKPLKVFISEKIEVGPKEKRDFFESIDITKYGDQGRYASKAIRAIQKGEAICLLDQEATVEDYLNAAHRRPAQDGPEIELNGRSGYPITSVFIPTMNRHEANITLVKDEMGTTRIVAKQQIEPNAPLRILVSEEEYRQWTEQLLREWHNRPLSPDRFNIAIEDEEAGNKVSQVINTNAIRPISIREEEWAQNIKQYQMQNRSAYRKIGPGSKQVKFIFQELIFKEIFQSLNPEMQIPEIMRVDYINQEVGCGAFATRDIAAGEFLGMYMGRLLKSKDMGDNTSYVFNLNQQSKYFRDWCIDASTEGNMTRFMNHANPESPDCNADFYYVVYGDRVYIVFQAKMDIKAGTEIRYNYGDSYWKYLDVNPIEDFSEVTRGASPQQEKENRRPKRKQTQESKAAPLKKKKTTSTS